MDAVAKFKEELTAKRYRFPVGKLFGTAGVSLLCRARDRLSRRDATILILPPISRGGDACAPLCRRPDSQGEH